MGIRSFVRRRPALSATAAVVALGLLAFGLYWFQPYKLFVDTRVDEALPTVPGRPVAGATTAPSPAAEPGDTAPSPQTTPDGGETLARGPFRGLEHDARGQARILRLADGSLYLRFDDLSVSNGPDLRVYLSILPASDDWYVWDDAEYLDLGGLKGNIGSQNYRLPGGIDLEKWMSAVVWCRRFHVGFAVAPLDRVSA